MGDMALGAAVGGGIGFGAGLFLRPVLLPGPSGGPSNPFDGFANQVAATTPFGPLLPPLRVYAWKPTGGGGGGNGGGATYLLRYGNGVPALVLFIQTDISGGVPAKTYGSVVNATGSEITVSGVPEVSTLASNTMANFSLPAAIMG